MDWLVDYWWAVALAALVAIVLLYLLLRPRQTVRLGDAAPIRAHMIQESGRGLVDEAAQAVEDAVRRFYAPLIERGVEAVRDAFREAA